jgi:hypothetical protein
VYSLVHNVPGMQIVIVIKILGCDSDAEVYHKLVVVLKGTCLLGAKPAGLTRKI